MGALCSFSSFWVVLLEITLVKKDYKKNYFEDRMVDFFLVAGSTGTFTLGQTRKVRAIKRNFTAKDSIFGKILENGIGIFIEGSLMFIIFGNYCLLANERFLCFDERLLCFDVRLFSDGERLLCHAEGVGVQKQKLHLQASVLPKIDLM